MGVTHHWTSLRAKLYLVAIPAILLAVLLLLATIIPFRDTRAELSVAKQEVSTALAAERFDRFDDAVIWHTAASMLVDKKDGEVTLSLARMWGALDAWERQERSAEIRERIAQIRTDLASIVPLAREVGALSLHDKLDDAQEVFWTKLMPRYTALDDTLQRIIAVERIPLSDAFVEIAGQASASSGFLSERLTSHVVKASQSFQKAEVGGLFQEDVLNEGRFAIAYVLGVETDTNGIDHFAADADNQLATWMSLAVRHTSAPDISKVRNSAEHLHSIVRRMASLTRAGEHQQAREIFVKEYEPRFDHQLGVTEGLVLDQENAVYAETSSVIREAHRIQVGTLIVVVALLLGAVLTVVSGRRIADRLKRLTSAAARVRDGDLTERVPVRRPDEIGRLAETFNSMSESLARARERTAGLLHRTVEGAESERTRLAADLHDGPVQRLTGVLYGLERVALRLDKQDSAGACELANQLRDKVSDEVRALRQLMSELRPAVLDERGLAPAIEAYVQEFGDREGVACDVTVALDERLDSALETTMYRIVQESLTNVGKHSKAEHVGVDVRSEKGNVLLTVRDDGVGFDPAQKRTGGSGDHFGLTSMEERVRMTGGSFELASRGGGGTTIVATFPRKAA